MPCPTCDHTLQAVGCHAGGTAGGTVFWCERCGTVRLALPGGATQADYYPRLIGRVRELRDVMAERVGFSPWDVSAWTHLGIFECIYLPEERPQP